MKDNGATNPDGPPPGGPSTITGIIYQMLWSLMCSLRVHLEEVMVDDHGRVIAAIITIEPRTGGDLQERHGVRRRVIQMKIRSGGRAWSLQEIVTKVLPDLYRAVDLHFEESSYEFVTEGRIGDWPEVYEFFQSLDGRDAPSPTALDDSKEIYFGRQKTSDNSPKGGQQQKRFWDAPVYTERSLFDKIVEHLRTTGAVPKSEHPDVTRAKVWHLLSKFQFVDRQSLEAIEEEVKAHILARVDYAEQVPEKLNAMLTWLQRRAMHGDAIIDKHALLRDHGLDVHPLNDLKQIAQSARTLFERHTSIRKYNPTFNVRAEAAKELAETWEDKQPLLALAGETGDGKTWQLYALGSAIAVADGIVVVIEATGDAEKDLTRAADVFWQEVMRHGGSQPLTRIARQWRLLMAESGTPPLNVLIDGVQSMAEAESLAHTDMAENGVRLAITCSPAVAEVFRRTGGESAHVVPVGPFGVAERDQYLERRLGEQWVRVPSDVRDVLRRPLLASIYCNEVADPEGWQPTDEYALFDRMWQRLVMGNYEPGPFDAARVGRLAASILLKGTYPWRAVHLEEAQIDELMFHRISRAGWLRTTEAGLYEIPHDRLLNYAVARGLVELYDTGKMSEGDLVALLRELLLSDKTYGGRRLPYVPMDVLHVLLEKPGGVKAAAAILAGLGELGHQEHRILYAELLPTLGERVVPLLFRRLEEVADAKHIVDARAMRDGIVSLDSAVIGSEAARLLESNSPALQRTAIALLEKRPTAAALDRLWQLHQRMQDKPEDYGDETQSIFLYRESFAALRSCVRLEPSWLEREIQRLRSGHPHIQDLAYLLANLPSGADIWRRRKIELIDKIPVAKERAIALNVERFRDTAEVNRMVAMVEHPEAGPAAVAALAEIDPDRAVQEIGRLPKPQMYFMRGWYLPRLIEQRPSELHRRVLELARSAEDPWEVAYVYQGHESEIPPNTLDFLLDTLEKQLTELLSSPVEERSAPLLWELGMLKDADTLEQLKCFEHRRGTALEDLLTRYLVARGPQRGQWVMGPERPRGLVVLRKIGGTGYTTVVNDFLAKGDHFGRMEAIEAAYRAADVTTRERLLSLVKHDDTSSAASLEQYLATDALAALGETGMLVEAVQTLGLQASTSLSELLTAKRPFDASAVESAAVVLTQEHATESQKVGAVMAIGIAGRAEHAGTILKLLEQASPDSDLALACTIALRELGDKSERIVELVRPQLRDGKNPYQAHLLLLQLGTDAALDVALEAVTAMYDARMAINLARRDRTREKAIELLAKRVAQDRASLWNKELTLALDYLDDTTVQRVIADSGTRDRLREAALAEEGRSWVVGSKVTAIRAVALFDPHTAFLATQKALEERMNHDRTRYPSLLLRLDPPRAVPILLRFAAHEESTAVRFAVARALAQADLESTIVRLLESPVSEERRLATELCAFRTASNALLVKLRQCLGDGDPMVAKAGIWALQQIRRTNRVAELADAFIKESTSTRKWNLLESIVHHADPGGDGEPRPLWLKSTESAATEVMWNHVSKVLKRRREKLRKDLERKDERD